MLNDEMTIMWLQIYDFRIIFCHILLQIIGKIVMEFHRFNKLTKFTLVTSCQSVNVGFYQLVTLLYRCNSDLIFKAWKSCLALSISFNFPSISNIAPSKLLQTFFFICLTSRLVITWTNIRTHKGFFSYSNLILLEFASFCYFYLSWSCYVISEVCEALRVVVPRCSYE